jgi:CheY-like chemotaxis protein
MTGFDRDGTSISFLIVEDDEDHAQLISRSLEGTDYKNKIFLAKDGEEAIDFLLNRGKFKEQTLPDIILLDLNLPKVNGHEVLQLIKNNSLLKKIPVIVLTTSSADYDRESAYLESANSYLVKPINYLKFKQMAQIINSYWSIWNQPPTKK